MKREELLSRLPFNVSPIKKKRVIIHSDIKCEADDQYAIVHHLMTPTEDVRGIVASHSEWKYLVNERLKQFKGTSMQTNYEEGQKILQYMQIDDIPLTKGAQYPFWAEDFSCESEGADFIIKEAMREEDSPLYIACQGALTDIAIAYQKEPAIANRLTVIWIGGAPYPIGGDEPNLKEDPKAAQIVFASPIPLWQIPSNVYGKMQVSLSEIAEKVKECGKIGEYLFEEMTALNDWYGNIPIRLDFPHGEIWSLGDNPTVSVLLQGAWNQCWEERKAPIIQDDMTYAENTEGKFIRVYESLDNRLTIDDFFSKLKLCYRDYLEKV